MKSLIPQMASIAVLVGGYLVASSEADKQIASYAFDPSKARQNICGPIGTSRNILFKPEVAHMLSNATYASPSTPGTVSLMPGLDTLDFPISSKNAEAQAYFRQGAALTYGFNHWEAIRAFKKAQALDPSCAICYWGEAMALGPNINAGMGKEAGEKALAAIRQAQALKVNASARERLLIEAMSVRYSDEASVGQGALNQRFSEAMARASEQMPEDNDIATLYAESLMTTAPWDYWERDFITPRPHIKTAIETIEKVLARNPNHYGAMHLLIHLYEASAEAERAEPYADKLAGLVPGAGHLVHMPGHIFYRVGRYLDSLDTNIKAVQVDETYLASTDGSDLYRYGYYPHNVHFVLVSAQMAGDAATALKFAKKLDPLIPVEVFKEAEWITPIKAAPYFAYAQFATLDDVMALPSPGDDVPYLKAMWHFARGVSLVEAGDERASGEIAAIQKLGQLPEITSAGFPADTLLKIAGNIVEAKLLAENGELPKAVGLMKDAIRLQDSLAYTEPPHWYYSVEQSLGSMLYQAGKFAEAEAAFTASLMRHPNSAWSLSGLAKTQRALGRTGEAAITEALLEKASRAQGEIAIKKL
ncbi:MAG: hypothetical protein JKY34_12940 [Kordiimonadaceae bacterium]|nr:hypothetical protein [Kordiimonadaceae bacterium]